MRRVVSIAIVAGVVATTHVGAQTPAAVPAAAQRARYQMGTMESVLQRAVDQAASVTRERLGAVIPARMLLTESTRVRGFRLEGYGLFFDVMVPDLEGALTWSYITLNQNDLGLDTAMRNLRAMVEKAGDPELRQDFDRIQLQIAPGRVTASATQDTRAAAARPVNAAPPVAARPAPADPILKDPQGVYRNEVINTLMDAMLDYSRGLELAANEWLSIGARRNDGARPGIAGAEAPTIQIRINGDALRGFWGGQVSREETRKRMDVQVF